MNETVKAEPDYSATLFLPETQFPMRAGLPEREPQWLKRWEELDIYQRQRMLGAGKPNFTLHDGPPYANGNIHIGHALNKILKDLVSRSMSMLGYNSAYVPGWDCHGLPIEWKIEEQYRAKGKDKNEVEINEFRAECRTFAQYWVDTQREEFKRLGVVGDWSSPYLTMSFDAEAQIARELMKVAASGQLYRGSKPVMWSVVERTALAEAEIEYADYESDTIWVKFPVEVVADSAVLAPRRAAQPVPMSTLIGTRVSCHLDDDALDDPRQPRHLASRARSPMASMRSPTRPRATGPRRARSYIIADKLAADVFAKAKVEAFERACRRSDELHAISMRTTLSAASAAATTSMCPCSTANTSPTTPAPASSTPRRDTASTTSRYG